MLTLGYPVAYNHFAEGQAPATPYILYYEQQSRNFGADGKVYHKISDYCIELYTDKKEPSVELALENLLDGAEYFYDKSETWIDSEKLYEILYTLEV